MLQRLLCTTNRRFFFSHKGRRLSSASVLQSTPSFNNNSFPSLIVSSNDIVPNGSFAEAQADYLRPDSDSVTDLVEALRKTNTGIVAHYYMDVELQGVLQAAASQLPNRIFVADSLAMGDAAVKMKDSVSNVICLGVDFMSESVAAVLRQNNSALPVYRVDTRAIGCSLAESAENDNYQAWLQTSSVDKNALHVVYINTSLATKAQSNATVPTITCTSSNVLSTLLHAHLQIPDLTILYGPDTYMGENLVSMLDTMAARWKDDQIVRHLHKDYTRDTLLQLRDSIVVFPHGNCVVHHMFGQGVVDQVQREYENAFITAHLEVPGEMFALAMEASLDNRGVVGSTSDILKFITKQAQIHAHSNQTLQFVLGTEAGMVTSIVKNVQSILKDSQCKVEIVFPVASDAVVAGSDEQVPLVPGVAGGEGCSTAGGCATCPYMKMNSLDSLMNVLQKLQSQPDPDALQAYLPPSRLAGQFLQGKPAMDWGTEPIQYMRHFSANQQLPDELVRRVVAS